MRSLVAALRWVQNKLEFEGWSDYPQFSDKRGLGRVAVLACLLGMILGVNLLLLLQAILYKTRLVVFFDHISSGTLVMIIQWLSYSVALSFFHLAEFFVTALCNPSVATAESFIINHSMAYTGAALLSWSEFWIRFCFFPSSGSRTISCVGLVILLAGQICRTLSMSTCGENFNHIIQYNKKHNHELVTHGIYKYFRHPSYVGFFYWSVGTQLLLCNPFSTVLFTVAAWNFFNKRIPYEEATLLRNFPDKYEEYALHTWIGIPFIRSKIARKTE